MICREKSREFKNSWNCEMMADCSSSDFKAKFKEETIIMALRALFFKITIPSRIWSICKKSWVDEAGIIYYLRISTCDDKSFKRLLPVIVGTGDSLTSGASGFLASINFKGGLTFFFQRYILGA